MIDDLSGMILERLRRYSEVTKILPERVFVYRDGVSEVPISLIIYVYHNCLFTVSI